MTTGGGGGTIQIDPEKMRQLAQKFEGESNRIKRLNQQFQQHLQTLKGGGWIADGATAFYKRTEGELLPAVQKLERALGTANTLVGNELPSLFKQAEEEAQSYLPNFGG